MRPWKGQEVTNYTNNGGRRDKEGLINILPYKETAVLHVGNLDTYMRDKEAEEMAQW